MRRYQIDLREFAPDRYAFNKSYRAQIQAAGNNGSRCWGPMKRPNSKRQDAARNHRTIDSPARRHGSRESRRRSRIRRTRGALHVSRIAKRRPDKLTSGNSSMSSRESTRRPQKLFAETFAQVRINFREMFTEVFGGGRADLNLIDENELWNAASRSLPGRRANNCRAFRCFPAVSRR